MIRPPPSPPLFPSTPLARSPASSTRRARGRAPASTSCSVPDPASPGGTSLRRARPSQGPLEQPPALHDDLEIVLGLQDAKVPKRVARDEIGRASCRERV